MIDQELSESGNSIYHYDDLKPKDFTPASGNEESIEARSDHIEKHVGKKEEMQLKLDKGVDALLDKFDKNNVLDVFDVKRINVATKKGFLGLW